MKKISVLFVVAALMLPAHQMNAQQRKSTTARKPATAQVTPVTINEPIGVDGHLAFMGVSQGQTLSKVKSDLAAKGFREGKDQWGNATTKGTAYGAAGAIYVQDLAELGGKGIRVTMTEDKQYTLPQAKQRMNALVAGFKAQANGKASRVQGMEPGAAGMEIVNDYGTITVTYHNADEIEGTSKYNVIQYWFDDNPKPGVAKSSGATTTVAVSGNNGNLPAFTVQEVLSAKDAITIYNQKNIDNVREILRAYGYNFEGLDNKQMENWSKNCKLNAANFKVASYGQGVSSVVRHKLGGELTVQVFNKKAVMKFVDELKAMGLDGGVAAMDGSAFLFSDNEGYPDIQVVCDKGMAYEEAGGYFLMIGGEY